MDQLTKHAQYDVESQRHRYRRGNLTLYLQVSLYCVYVVIDVVFQSVILPRLLDTLSNEYSLVLGLGTPILCNQISDQTVLAVTNILEQRLHLELYAVDLEPIERESLRKCSSLVTVLQFYFAKLPVVVLSFTASLRRNWGVCVAFAAGVALPCTNALLRHFFGQNKANKTLQKTLAERNNHLFVCRLFCFCYSTRKANVLFSDKRLENHDNTLFLHRLQQLLSKASHLRSWLGLSSVIRRCVWLAAVASIAMFLLPEEVSLAMRSKIFSELYSMDTRMDKCFGSLAPAMTLYQVISQRRRVQTHRRHVQTRYGTMG